MIELLIVVAIIAILAGIAVPNFLEAQTRAKVSRAKSDLRAMGIALETWRIEVGHYPASFPGNPSLTSLQALSTPIAHISSIPSDVFAEGVIKSSYPGMFDWSEPYKLNGNLLYPLTFQYFLKAFDEDDTSAWSSHSEARWCFTSVGPDAFPTGLGLGTPAYDPSNGTTSYGDIYYTGPSIGFDQPAIEPYFVPEPYGTP